MAIPQNGFGERTGRGATWVGDLLFFGNIRCIFRSFVCKTLICVSCMPGFHAHCYGRLSVTSILWEARGRKGKASLVTFLLAVTLWCRFQPLLPLSGCHFFAVCSQCMFGPSLPAVSLSFLLIETSKKSRNASSQTHHAHRGTWLTMINCILSPDLTRFLQTMKKSASRKPAVSESGTQICCSDPSWCHARWTSFHWELGHFG